MTVRPTAAIVLATGAATGMRSSLPMVMRSVGGRPLILHTLASLTALDLTRLVVVLGARMTMVAEAVRPLATVVQREPRGIGHAVMTAREAMLGFTGDILVLFGDTPLVTSETLGRLLAARRAETDPAAVVLGFRSQSPDGCGRLLLARDGTLEAIIEAKNASPEQLSIRLCDSGIMALDGKRMFGLLDQVGKENTQGAYFLTGVIATARARGFSCAMVCGEEAELARVTSRADLLRAERAFQDRLRKRAGPRDARHGPLGKTLATRRT